MNHTQADRENHLPDGWREAYYEEESDGELTYVTAAYEHPESGFKWLVHHANNPRKDLTKHEVHSVYPVPTDIGIPHQLREIGDELRDFLVAIVPETKPYQSDIPSLNEGPYKELENRETEPYYDWRLNNPRVAEGDLNSDKMFVDPTEIFETFQTYPISLEEIAETASEINTVHRIWQHDSTLVETPYPITLIVQEWKDGKLHPETRPYANKLIQKAFGKNWADNTDFSQYEDSKEIGTIWVEFNNNRGFCPNTVDVSHTSVKQ